MNKPALTIGILECGSNRKEWVDAHGDFADWFKPFLSKAANRPISFKVFRAHLDELPGNKDEADVWLVTGSPTSVYEEPNWQVKLTGFLRTSSLTKPIIGICYGHQLLHHMLGGKVEKMPLWGIGVHTYDVLDHPLWLNKNNRVQQLALLVSHQDQVTHRAADSTLIATSSFCQNAITQIGSTILTVQAHPELTKALAREAYEFRREDQGQDLTNQALATIHDRVTDEICGAWVFDFIDHVRGQPSNSSSNQ